MDRDFLKQTFSSIIVVIVGLFGLWVLYKTTDIFKISPPKPEQPKITQPEISKEEVEQIKKKQLTEFEKFQSYQKITTYKDFVTPAEINKFCLDTARNDEMCKETIAKLTTKLQVSGNVEDAYIYIKAGVSRSGMPIGQLTPYDSVYLYLDESKNGGHLIRPKAIIYRSSEDGLTELLYKLDNLPFTHLPYSETASPDENKNSNLLSILKTNGTHYLGSYVSTLGYGEIFELVIGYKGGEIQVIE